MEQNPQVLDYGQPAANDWPRILFRFLGVVAAVAGLFAAVTLPVRKDKTWMDGVTGSIVKETIWFNRFSTGRRLTPSAIEIRLNKLGVQFTPKLRYVSGPEKSLFGATVLRACGSVPPIYRFPGDLNDLVANSTDQQLLSFVNVMQNGTDAQQEALVDTEFQRVFSHP